MAGGVTAEVPTIKTITKLLVINFIIKLYALKNNFELINNSLLSRGCFSGLLVYVFIIFSYLTMKQNVRVVVVKL